MRHLGEALAAAFFSAVLALGAAGGAAAQGPVQPSVPVTFVPLPARAAVTPAMPCAALAGRDFAETKDGAAAVTSAAVEAAKPGRAEFCLVKGYVAPNIHFELRLPTSGYTGRYLQVGCGGSCGIIPSNVGPACDNAPAYGGAFAVGGEDSGHTGQMGSARDIWALGGEEVRADFAYRAAHAFAVAAKAIVAAYYGQPPAFSYFDGCSDGGREAMAETQRYPTDFNGVVAGSPAFDITEAMERFLWEARWGHDDNGGLVFDAAALQTLHAAVMNACDGLDGLKDGQIDDPRLCHFDPKTVVCASVGQTGCLTPLQADVARRFYEGPKDASGVALFTGGEAYGSELTWTGRGAMVEAGAGMLSGQVGDMIYHGDLPASVTVRTWKFDVPTLRDMSRRGAIYDANDPDLRPFQQAGGKLIMWHGGADPAAGVYGVEDYYQRLRNVVGGLEPARSFARVFVVPGVYHCFGGYMPYQEDFLGAMVAWVEQGHAPDQVIATAPLPDGGFRSRPIFAYPVRAKYIGHGSVNDAASFVAAAPAKAPDDLYAWAGAQP